MRCSRDFVNHNITIQGHQVEISSDISDTLDEFREILAQTIVQNSNPVESISNFVEELVTELQNNPEVKSYFNADKNINEKELADTILKLVLTQKYNFQNSSLQILNNDNELDSADYLENEEEEEENYKYVSYHRGYKIDLAKDHLGYWSYKIKKGNDIPSLYTTYDFVVEDALSKARTKIDEEIFNDWSISD